MPRTHKTLPRLHLDAPMTQDASLDLDKAQTNYLVNVLRRGEGDDVVVFNGRDGAWLARLRQTGKKTVALDLIEQSAPQTQANDLWCGFAPIKRQDYLVQKATEMGAGVIQPVLTAHVQNPRVATEKWRANAVEAAEQCEVLSVPEIGEPVTLAALLDGWGEAHGDRVLVFADESAAASSPVETLARLKGRRLGLLIGPEGGFSDAERENVLGRDFVAPISLGPRILRADTAAVAALALIQAAAGDW